MKRLAATLGLLVILSPMEALAQRQCASPSPTLLLVRQRALAQVRGGERAIDDVDLSNTSGVERANFSETAVGYAIADHMIRTLAPMALERVGERAFARRLRALAPVNSQQTAFRAQDLAEDVANTMARRMGRVRWSTPRGAAVEVVVEGAALAGYAATPGSFNQQRYVTTISSGIGAARRIGLSIDAVASMARAMLVAAAAVSRCP